MLNVVQGVVRPRFFVSSNYVSKSTLLSIKQCRLISYSQPVGQATESSQYVRMQLSTTRPKSDTTNNRSDSTVNGQRDTSIKPHTNTKYGSVSKQSHKMGKKKSSTPGEENLLMPAPPSTLPIVDTHTHVASTYEFYRIRYTEGKHESVYEFLKGMFKDRSVEAVVDVWCEAPVRKQWREFADAAVDLEKWGGTQYWFAIGVHPHDAKNYTDEVEKDLIEAASHPRCVSWGEMGLDYHYDNSPREIQQDVFTRQLRQAVKLGKPLTIHTREADEDTERILKAEVPKDHRIHIHCFTDTPEFAQNLLDHFPNLYIGITGVMTYATNENTSQVVRNLAKEATADASSPKPLRILLETDAPYMVPANLYDDLVEIKGKKLPVCHSAMIPWTAKFVADVAGDGWDADRVMREGRDNARKMYGV